MNRLLGKSVMFIPCCMADKHGGTTSELAKPVRGTIVCVHNRHRWFIASYKIGENELRECFGFDDIGKAVTVFGK